MQGPTSCFPLNVARTDVLRSAIHCQGRIASYHHPVTRTCYSIVPIYLSDLLSLYIGCAQFKIYPTLATLHKVPVPWQCNSYPAGCQFSIIHSTHPTGCRFSIIRLAHPAGCQFSSKFDVSFISLWLLSQEQCLYFIMAPLPMATLARATPS